MMRLLAKLSASVIMRENSKESDLTLKSGWREAFGKILKCGNVFSRTVFWGRGLRRWCLVNKVLGMQVGDQSWSLSQNLGQMWFPVIPAERSSMQTGYRLGNKHTPCVGEAALVKWREWRAWCQPLSSRVHTGLLLKRRNAHTQLSAKNTFILLEVKH